MKTPVPPRSPLRIGLLLPNLRTGGAERQMFELATRLPKDRFTVEFLAIVGRGPLDDQAQAAGVTVRHVGQQPLHTAGVVSRGLGRIGKVGALVREIRRRRYDVLDAWIYPLDVLAVMTRPLTRVPIVISGRRNMLPHDAFGPLSPAVDRVMRRGTDVVVANSEAAARYAVAMHWTDPRRLRVIRNGVARSPVASHDERAAIRARFGAGSADVVIGCVANLRPEKRHDLVLAVFSRVLEEQPSARLVVVGDGPERQRIERDIERLGIGTRVHLTGNVLDARPLYAGFDLVVQASDTEGLPNVVLEAAAAGLAIVATDAGGTGEIVTDGETGILVPVGSVEGLTRGIRSLVQDEGLRARLGAAASSRTETAFGMDRFVREFGELYESLVDARRAAPPRES
jgi:glycosyltransferase involved in cell wall biosynthesis